MLPAAAAAGLVWGHPAGDGTTMMMTPAGGAISQPLVYCYSPAPAAGPAELPASLTYHQQQLLQQQQQMLMAAKSQQQQQQQQVYVQTALGLQPCRLPAAGSPAVLPAAAGAGLPLHAITANLPGGGYLPPQQLYLPSPAAATSVTLTSARKVCSRSFSSLRHYILPR